MTGAEKKLIQNATNGDLKSFEELIKTYQLYAYNISLKMMGNEEDAKDTAQDALIKVYKNLKSFKGDSTFSTWLYRIVMNTCKDELRRRKNLISIDEKMEVEDGEIGLQLESTSYNPVTEYERSDIKEKMQIALSKLPDNNKSVIILRDIHGYSYEEISKIEDIAIGTIKSRINRGRKLLKDIIKNEMHKEFNL
ncbi:MAG: sigma-70 family RNA polymerase sigma factor [Acidaminobacteraceae bacterium]